METRKLTKEDIDKVRHIDGFPTAKDEDIIALSNAPYYTACPNPFIEDFIKEYGKIYDEKTDDYHREPFAADVSEGKNDPIYNAHSYHTKVPYKAIMKYIFHYTNPGDIVFDGFCGTGMTGVAAQLCGKEDTSLQHYFGEEFKKNLWGARKAIINDLSPVAAFIARNYTEKIELTKLEQVANEILSEFYTEYSWMYSTKHKETDDITALVNTGTINYTVWSDVLICPSCGIELCYWDLAVQLGKGEVLDEFSCKKCGVKLKKKD